MTGAGTVSKWNYTEEELQLLVGKHVLVGTAHCNREKAVVSREQFHGMVKRVNLKEGIVIDLNNAHKEERAITLDIDNMEKARPGEYTLAGTGEVIKNPDFTIRQTQYDKN